MVVGHGVVAILLAAVDLVVDGTLLVDSWWVKMARLGRGRAIRKF